MKHGTRCGAYHVTPTFQRRQRLWFRLVFSGRANAPDYVDSSSDVIEAVERQDGALGILVSDVAPSVREGLVVVELK